MDLKREKRLVTAVLHSKSVDIADLAGFTGAKPRSAIIWREFPERPVLAKGTCFAVRFARPAMQAMAKAMVFMLHS